MLGQGGFGTVYRARFEDDGGFQRDVAIKVLTAPNAGNRMLQRFRDEARLLGLLRDRAVVVAHPPIRLNGRWAVVMDLADGQSLEEIIQQTVIPPGPTAEIIGEVARALADLWEHPGPGGEPLRLRHRDLKPGNLQLSDKGVVRVLDLGLARAAFEEREIHTTQQHMMGTPGYIPPERVTGDEGPPGDIYALGVVVLDLIQGRDRRHTPTDPASVQLLAFAKTMSAFDPVNRPSTRTVERFMWELRRSIDGASLRDWAAANVRQRELDRNDPMVGQVLTESVDQVDTSTSPPPFEVRAGDVVVGRAMNTPAPTVSSELWDSAAAEAAADRRKPLIWLGSGVALVLLALGLAASLWPDPAAQAPAAAPIQVAPAAVVGSAAVVADADAEPPAAPANGTATTAPPPQPASNPRPTPASPTRPAPPKPTPADPAPAPPPPAPVVAAAEPEAPARPTTVPVGLAGDAEAVTLICGRARHRLPGPVPVGRCLIEVDFPEGEPFRLPAPVDISGPSTVACTAGFQKCVLRR